MPAEPSGEIVNVRRIVSGVKGLDDLVEGGIPENSVILLSGSTGTGKSTFAMNFLVEGAMNNEPGVYICLEESVEENILRMNLFGWPIDRLVAGRKLLVTKPELYDFDRLLTHIEDAVAKIGARRLVVDSISLISMYFKDPFKVRRALLDLEQSLKKLGCTTIAVTEIPEESTAISTHGVEEFIVDGVIVLYYLKKGNVYSRAVAIRKMRSTNHSLKIHPVQIKRPGGLVVYPAEEVFTEI